MFWVGEGIHKGKWMACTGIKPEPWCYQHHALTTKLIPASQSFWLTLSWNVLKNMSVSPLKGFLQVKLLGSLDRDSKVKVWTLLGDTIEHFYPVMTYFHKVWLNEGTEPHTTESPLSRVLMSGLPPASGSQTVLTGGCWAIPTLHIRKTRTTQSVTAKLHSAWGLQGDRDVIKPGKLQKPVQERLLNYLKMTLYVCGKPLIPYNLMHVQTPQ